MTRTEELREKIAACSRDDAYDGLGLSEYNKGWRNKEHHAAGLASADKILQALQDAGLAFVVKDAELPALSQQRCTHIDETWFRGIEKIASTYYEAQEDMRKAGFRQTEEIEVS